MALFLPLSDLKQRPDLPERPKPGHCFTHRPFFPPATHTIFISVYICENERSFYGYNVYNKLFFCIFDDFVFFEYAFVVCDCLPLLLEKKQKQFETQFVQDEHHYLLLVRPPHSGQSVYDTYPSDLFCHQFFSRSFPDRNCL